jgi:hypothetical protein
MKIEFSLNVFDKNIELSNIMKILLVAAELFQADGQTDMTNLMDAFRSSAIASVNYEVEGAERIL